MLVVPVVADDGDSVVVCVDVLWVSAVLAVLAVLAVFLLPPLVLLEVVAAVVGALVVASVVPSLEVAAVLVAAGAFVVSFEAF